jgi:phosphopantothenate synthetase
MEKNTKVNEPKNGILGRYNEQINRAYERAVREALRKHKLAGNPVAISRNGNVVLLQPDEIDIEDE